MALNVVIIGGVAAGPKTACRLKRILPDAEITIVDQDNLISYGGCGIPYYVSEMSLTKRNSAIPVST